MQTAFAALVHWIVFAIDAIAVVIVVIGVVDAMVGITRLVIARRATDHQMRVVWLRFARWLVAGLTFQLAADIVETTIAPDWEDIGRVAAIALIRTLLTYFLDRDLDAIRERELEPGGTPSNRLAESAKRT